MSHQVTEEDTSDKPGDQSRQREQSRTLNNNKYQSDHDLSSISVLPRSKSDMHLASSKIASNSPNTPSGFVEPRPLGYSSTTMVSLARPATNRICRAASLIPPIPSRSPRDELGLRRVVSNSESNPYDFSKSIAESAMDISLLTANGNQLRLLITYNQGSQTYMACITCISMSLVLQMLVAITMIIISLMKQNLKDSTRQKLKIITSVGVAVITVINILVASLVVAEAPNPMNFASVSTTVMPLTTTTIGTSTSTISSTVKTLLEEGLSTMATRLLANDTGT